MRYALPIRWPARNAANPRCRIVYVVIAAPIVDAN